MNDRVLLRTPHHLAQNKKYLDLCKESVKRQTYKNIEHWIISTEEYPHLDSATKKVNYVLKAVEQDPPAFFCHISDDVMLTETAIESFVFIQKRSKPIIQFSISNNENGHNYCFPLSWGNDTKIVFPKTTFEYDEIAPYKEDVFKMRIAHPAIIPVKWSAFHTVFFPYSVYQKVGPLDEGTDIRHNDEDFCIRALKHQINCAYNPGAVAIHFGNKTLGKNPNKELDERKCSDYFIKKHGYETVIEWQTTDLAVLCAKYFNAQ